MQNDGLINGYLLYSESQDYQNEKIIINVSS